ncbi:PPOX class F420-dependent enzyme [Mycobacterium asiaticum]|uniref:PPOX class F420-dependent enzyme n=2 Tax=Mycobacterium asiaticum TaxID=1790 RepID=A0A1A3N826_MYCAS|nr:PPOX class F420-dependent enzyme [Mycobacterium asiaticum]
MRKSSTTATRLVMVAATALTGVFTFGIGIWCLVDPASFAKIVHFPTHQHFLHDLGAFQLGLGVALLLALIWADALATALAAMIVANTVHTVNHVLDLPLGGSVAQAWMLGAMTVLLVVAFVLRLQQLDYVLGAVAVATDRKLAPFVRQKTINLTTFRKDGTAGTSPVSIVVDGDRAYFRSFERSLKVRRLRRNPRVEFGAATGKGKPDGPVQPGAVRLLEGAEDRAAARLLRRKYPFLHGILVPMAHRLMRSKFGRTVHAELLPAPVRAASPPEYSCPACS